MEQGAKRTPLLGGAAGPEGTTRMLSSRERLLRAITGEEVDHAPLCPLLFSGLQGRCRTNEEFLQRQLNLGVDVLVDLGAPSLEHAPGVRTECWLEPARPNPLLHKTYRTPAGDLHAIVEKTPDWPHGDDIPLMSDFVIPRARKFPVCEEKDLEPLSCLLAPPAPEVVSAYLKRAEERRMFAAAHGLAARAGFSRLSDTICWLCGCEPFATLGLTNPRFFGALVELIARRQEAQIAAALEAQPDVLVDAQWYGTTFLSPSLYAQFLAPALQRRVNAAREAGARFCAVATANVLPFAGCLLRLGIDALFGVDPLEGGWDLPRAKQELGKRICLWGGINGYLTLAHGSPAETREAVRYALEILAPGGRFILAPVDDVRIEHADRPPRWEDVWRNVLCMVEEWKRLA